MQRRQAVPGRAHHHLRALLLACCAAAAGWSVPALAQGTAKTTEEMERAQRDADKVFKMILINSDAPRKKRAPDAGAAAAAAPAPAPARAATGNSPEAIAAAAALAATRAGTEAAKPPPAAAPAPTEAASTQIAAAPQSSTPAPAAAAAFYLPPPAAAAEEDDEDDSALVPLLQVRPAYRSALMREIGKGTVRVQFEVQPDGSVSKQEVLSSSHRGLNQATLMAVGQWKFQPIKKPRQAQVELGFNIDQ